MRRSLVVLALVIGAVALVAACGVPAATLGFAAGQRPAAPLPHVSTIPAAGATDVDPDALVSLTHLLHRRALSNELRHAVAIARVAAHLQAGDAPAAFHELRQLNAPVVPMLCNAFVAVAVRQRRFDDPGACGGKRTPEPYCHPFGRADWTTINFEDHLHSCGDAIATQVPLSWSDPSGHNDTSREVAQRREDWYAMPGRTSPVKSYHGSRAAQVERWGTGTGFDFLEAKVAVIP